MKGFGVLSMRVGKGYVAGSHPVATSEFNALKGWSGMRVDTVVVVVAARR